MVQRLVAVIALSLFALSCSRQIQEIPSEKILVSKPDVQAETVHEDLDQLYSQVIYGQDNRQDLYQIQNPGLRRMGYATAALFKTNQLAVGAASGTIALQTESFRRAYNLCPEEPFADQNIGAFCSGFLVAPNVLVTAGHCIETQAECEKTAFVFGFAMREEGRYPTQARYDEVYRCRELVYSELNEDTMADFAVVILDRPNPRAYPLKINPASRPIAQNTPLFVMGYPAGLPLKFAPGARVRSVEDTYFYTDLDTYGGNSGSAVLNARTGRVEGILVRGDQDFRRGDGGCRESNRCDQNDCEGEEVTHIKLAIPYIQYALDHFRQ